jgi:hypothetical protein
MGKHLVREESSEKQKKKEKKSLIENRGLTRRQQILEDNEALLSIFVFILSAKEASRTFLVKRGWTEFRRREQTNSHFRK